MMEFLDNHVKKKGKGNSRSLKAIRKRRGFRDDALNSEASQNPNLFCDGGRTDSAPPRVSIMVELNTGAAPKVGHSNQKRRQDAGGTKTKERSSRKRKSIASPLNR